MDSHGFNNIGLTPDIDDMILLIASEDNNVSRPYGILFILQSEGSITIVEEALFDGRMGMSNILSFPRRNPIIIQSGMKSLFSGAKRKTSRNVFF